MVNTTSRRCPHPPATAAGASTDRDLPRAHSWLWLFAVILVFPAAIRGQMLSVDDVTVVESDGGTREAMFTVSVSGITPLLITVYYETADDSATVADGDYQPTSGTLRFEDTLPQPVFVTIYGDTKAEPDESFFVNLSDANNATIADGQGQGTIQNDDPLPELRIDDVTVIEGDAGTTDADFTVTLTGDFSEPVTVSYATADGTATVDDGDYKPVSERLTFEPGEESLTRTVTVEVNGDLRGEEDETFFALLSEPVKATIAGDPRGTATIQDDDPPPVLSIDDVMMDEGDAGTTEVSLTVTLTGAVGEPVTVSYATEDGTATVADGDYQAISDTLTFEPDGLLIRTRPLPVHVNGDTSVEPDETFGVVLFGDPDRVTIADGRGEVTIKNDDEASQLRLTSALSTMENAGMAVVTVERVGAARPG